MRHLRIAMIGTRGVPAQSGGVERHVEELSARLVDRGHDVTVFCRPGYAPDCGPTHRGVRLAVLPTVHLRGGEALVHSGLGTLSAHGHRFDVAHFHAMGPGLFTPLCRTIADCAVVQTIHGLDDQRDKWGGGARRLLGFGALLSAHVPDEVLVVSHALGDHYRERYGRYTTYVTNGVPETTPGDPQALAEHGLEPGGYLLYVGRLVPEKDPELLLRAYADVPGDRPLVVVGDSSDTDRYVERLRGLAAADPRVRLVGSRYGAELAALFSGARLFVQPSLLEGLPITVLEAAAYGVPLLASDIAPHREVVGTAQGPGRSTFRAGDRLALTAALRTALAVDDGAARTAARAFRADVAARYDWEVATDRLEAAYDRALRRRAGRTAPATLPTGRSARPASDLRREVAAR